MEILNEQELHNLAMNVVGEDLQEKGFEFLAINSELKRNPQFVAIKGRNVYLVVVRAIPYPLNPKEYDKKLMRQMTDHALKVKAGVFWAGVGLANARDYLLPVSKEEDFIVNYSGYQKLLKAPGETAS